MRLDIPETLDPQNFEVNLIGESFVPQVILIEPVEMTKSTNLNFGLSFVKENRSKIAKIKNIGKVGVKVMAILENNDFDAFSIEMKKENEELTSCKGKEIL